MADVTAVAFNTVQNMQKGKVFGKALKHAFRHDFIFDYPNTSSKPVIAGALLVGTAVAAYSWPKQPDSNISEAERFERMIEQTNHAYR